MTAQTLFLCMSVAMTLQCHSALAAKPNVILIIADDMAWNDCGAYGHPKIRTPNIDRLAREGMTFNNAFLTTSSCSPSRCSIITGRFPHNTGAGQLHLPLPKEQVTFPELLKQAEYYTGAAGKWHLGPATKPKFDVVREGGNSGGAEHWVPMLKDRPTEKPFFFWFASFDPHRPYQKNMIAKPHDADDVVLPPFIPDTPKVRDDFALYYDEIGRLDENVGKVLAELDRQKIADNTLVMFITDNGRPFPRCKTTLFDSGLKTPMLVRWPGTIKPGSVSNTLVSTIDIAPTFLDLAKVEVPPSMQGVSFRKLFTKPEETIRNYVHAEHNWHDFDDRQRSVRDNHYLLIVNEYTDITLSPPADAVKGDTFQEMIRLHDAGELPEAMQRCFEKPRPKYELYNCASDPFQMRNIAGNPSMTEQLKRLQGEYQAWQKRTEDMPPKQRRPDEFDRRTGDRLNK